MVLGLSVDLPKSLSTIVEERLRDAIVNAELSFGQSLSEDALGLSMGVSRTPMREALTRLQAQGLVMIVPKRGTFVFKPTAADVEQLAAFRLLLESAGVEACIASAAPATRADMAKIVKVMSRARSQGDSKAYARADTTFHESFFAHCGNAYLSSAYRNISWRVAALRAHLSVPRIEEQQISMQEHEDMMACMDRQDKANLLGILRQHILRSAKVYADGLEKGVAFG